MSLFYVDYIATLMTEPRKKWGPIRPDVLGKVKRLIADGHNVVLWTAAGTGYAKMFAVRYDIDAMACLCKPGIIVDDNPNIRPRGYCNPVSPEEFLEREYG